MTYVAKFALPLALGALVLGSSAVQGATVPFALEGDLQISLTSPPSANATSVASGSISTVPFGNATSSSTGRITFLTSPSGVVSPATSTNDFTFTFASGATLRGTTQVIFGPTGPTGSSTDLVTLTFSGGTDTFAGATGSGTGIGTSFAPSGPGLPARSIFTSVGQINAPALAVPEPATGALFLVGLAGLALRRFGRAGKQSTQAVGTQAADHRCSFRTAFGV